MTVVGREAQEVLVRAAELRERALTPEQRARREVVAARSAVIQAGVRPPASGIFGVPKKAKAA